MRKNFILFVLIPFIIFAVVAYFFIDRWIESGIEYAAEDAVGARVEIDNLSVTFSPLGLKFSKLQVADPSDPWKNIFETGKVAVRDGPRPALAREVHRRKRQGE